MALKGSKLLSRSAALEDADVLRCHEHCGLGPSPVARFRECDNLVGLISVERFRNNQRRAA